MDLKKLEAIIKIEPNNPKHWFNLGIAYLQENRIDAAHKSFDESVKVNPYFAPSQFFLGALLLYGRDFKNGSKYLEKAVTIDENVYNKLNGDSNIKNILDNLVKASVKVIQDQLEFQPNNIELLTTMGKILLYVNSFESSINYFRKVIELKPDNMDAYVYLGIAYENIENYDQAIFYLKKAIVINPYLAEAYWILARIYQKIGNYGMALKNYEKAVEISPSNTRYLNSLANIYLTLEKNVQAIKTLQLAIDNNPNSKWSYYYLGQCLEKEYNFEIAMEQYEKALNIDPYFLEARISLAKIYQMNDTKRAIEILEEVADDYQDKEIIYLLAQLYYSQKNFLKSLEISQKLIKINPDDYNIFYLYTLSLLNVYKQGYNVEKEILMKNLEIIYNKDPNNPVISSEFLKLCVDESDFAKAKQILEKSNVNLKNKEIAEKVALIYLQDQEHEKLINIIKTYEIFSYGFINQIFTYLKEKDSPYLSILYNQILNTIQKEWKEEQVVKFKLDYLEYLYFSNTLQALEFYKQLFNEKFFAENLNEKYNLTLFGLLIYFTLYSEYKDKKYLDDFINIADSLFFNGEILDENKLSHSKLSQKLVNNIKIVSYFYFLVIKSKNDLIPKIYDYLIKTSSKTNILISFLGEALPIFLDNNYYQEALEVIQKFDLENISSFKKIKIETLFLLVRNNEVINEAEEYLEKFSYDSYVELLKIIADFEINGNYELYIDNLEKIVMESNPLALAIYAKILASKNINEAIKYADRTMEFIYTGKHSLKNTYQLVMIIEILSRFYESIYKLSHFIKGLKQIVSKYPDVYAFNYLLAKNLFMVEDFVDAELVAKKALKLTQSSNSLLQTQNILSKIREEKENYQKLIYELQKINPQIPEKIAYINTLYKKDKIDEIYKLLNESQENTIDNLIIRFYIFDKLEIKEQIIYHLNLLKIFAIENSLEALIELVENKLLLYSNVEEFEEIKSKAEIDYLKLYKETFHKKMEQKVSKDEGEVSQDKQEVSQEIIKEEIIASQTSQVYPSFSSLEDYYNLQETKII
ncbi:MAG: tetratricopeptide repeat protein, partial [bacterium]